MDLVSAAQHQATRLSMGWAARVRQWREWALAFLLGTAGRGLNLQVAPQQGFMTAVTPSSNNDLDDLLQVLGAYQRLGPKAKTSDSG